MVGLGFRGMRQGFGVWSELSVGHDSQMSLSTPGHSARRCLRLGALEVFVAGFLVEGLVGVS